MSKNDRLGPIVRAMVGIDVEYHGVLTDIVNRLNSKDALAWSGIYTNASMAGLPKVEPVASPPLLTFDGKYVASVALNERHDPASFWHNTAETPARYVWSGFTTHVVAKAKPRDPSGIVKIRYADLPCRVKVRAILAASGVGNFDPSDLSAIIAAMIAKQPNGEPGDLLNDGKANLFPCGSVLAHVDWSDDRRGWYVSDWSPDDAVSAGRRVFSGNLLL